MPLFYATQTDYVEKMNASSGLYFNTDLTATSGGTTTLNLGLGGSFFVSMASGNTTFAFTNVPMSTSIIRLWIKQDIIGSRTVAFPASVIWADTAGVTTLPAPSTAASSVTLYELITNNSGTLWRGRCLAKGYAS